MGKSRAFSIILAIILLACCPGVEGSATNLLRLEGSCGWTEQITVKQGTTAYLVVLAAKEGVGTLNELSPDGCVAKHNYFFRVYDRLPFSANDPGRHVLSYTIDGKESNAVQIDVAGTSKPSCSMPSHCASPKGDYRHNDRALNYALPNLYEGGAY